jgi:hypothetical protein
VLWGSCAVLQVAFPSPVSNHLMQRPRPKTLSATEALILSLSLAWVIIFALDLLPILRGGYDWAWHFKPVLERYRVAPLILVSLCYVPIGAWLRRRNSNMLLIWAFLGSIGLTLASVHVRGDILYRLYSLTVSGRASGWHMAAAHIQNLPLTLQQWPQFMLESELYSSHIDHSPPGMVLIYYAFGHLLDQMPWLANWMARPLRWLLCQYLTGYTDGQYASAWLGIVTPLWASLTVFPLHGLGKRVFGSELAGWSVLWWPLIPSFLVFAPLPYTSYALPALVVIASLWEGLRSDQLRWVVVAGSILSALTFLNFVFAPLLLFAGLSTLGMYWLRNRGATRVHLPRYWPIRIGLCFGLGTSIAWLMFQYATRASLWGILQTAQQTQMHVAQVRPYWPFLAWNWNDLGMFTGWPLMLLAAVGTWAAVRNIAANRDPKESDVMIVAAALTLVIIDLSGTPRGETGRLLMFLAPWVLYAAGYGLRLDRAAGGLLTIVQALAMLAVVICLQVLAPEFKARAAPAAPPAQIPAVQPANYHVGAVFNDSIRLASVAGRIDSRVNAQGTSEPVLYLWLTWNELKAAAIPYAYAVQLSSPDGTISSAKAVIDPFGESYPITCWKPGEEDLTDRLRLPLTMSARGPLWVNLAILDRATGKTLSVVTENGLQLEQLLLGPFEPSQ